MLAITVMKGSGMGFVEIRFPDDIAYGSTGGPEFSTSVVETAGGYEQRNVNWGSARARYNVAHGVKTQSQLDALIAFFRARKGRAYAFRFKDWGDYRFTNEAIGTGNGVETSFQLTKSYTSGGVVVARVLHKPVNGTVEVYSDGVLQNSGVTVDSATGIVTFSVPPVSGASITASGEFDVPVRFDTDTMQTTLDTPDLRSWPDIPLIEVRV